MNIAKFLLLISLVSFIACSSDDEDGIAGSWTLSSLDLDCRSEPNLSQTLNSTNGCFTLDDEEICIRITFYDNGVGSLDFSINGTGEISDFSYTMNTSETEVEVCNNNECSIFGIRGERLLLIDSLEGCDAVYSFERQ